jgi:tetratricopeptide (TPR) repeat protein
MVTSLPAMVDLREDPGGDLILSWTETPGARNKAVSRADVARLRRLADAVSLAESLLDDAAIIKSRADLSQALFDLLDGPERALGQRIKRAEAERRRLDLIVRATSADQRALSRHPAAWMRWELLPFAETRRRGTPPCSVVLQLGPTDLAAPRVLESGGLRILFMAFSPQDAPPELDFEREEEELLTALAPMAEKRRARLRVAEEGTLEDLRATLLLERFDVVHLSGHGRLTAGGPLLVFEDPFGGKRLVSPEEILEAFQAAKEMPELVMLACCHSAEVRGSVASFAAELVAGGVPNVLGWTRRVRDDLATAAAASVYEQLGACKTPVEAAQLARERMRRAEERDSRPSHAWGTLALVSGFAAGFRVDDRAEPLSEGFDPGEVYKYLGSRMRVLRKGFVGRRRLVQRLSRVLLRGQDARKEATRDVAGACVFGMKGVGKSCAVGRAIERAKQQQADLGVVVLHGAVDGRSVLEAFQEAVEHGGGDEEAERLLARADEPFLKRVQAVMKLWRRRPMAIVLDDFEQNLEPREGGAWIVAPEAAGLLEALLPVCATGKPKLVITSTAEFQVPGRYERAIAMVPLGSFDAAAVRKLWMRGQASNELSHVSLSSWQDLADRLGRNARILTWARALCAGKTDDELAGVARRAAMELPVWAPGDEVSEEKHAELAQLFLQHMALEQASAAFGDAALAFVKRARVFEAAVPREAFKALAEGLAIDLDRDLDALASCGLLEVGELDGARAYRVSPLVEPKLDAADATRWHEAAAEAWERLVEKAPSGAGQLERTRRAWEHTLKAGHMERAERLGRTIDAALWRAGLYVESLRLAERHLEALPESPFGHQWAGYSEFAAGRPGPRATGRVQRGYALLVRALGTDEHLHVAASLHALGGVLHAQGDIAGARAALERSLAILMNVHVTDEHPNIAASLHELGGVLHAQGDLAGARSALERALAVTVRVYGTDEHPDVGASLHELGRVLHAQGDLASARSALERSLTIHTNLQGTDEHPAVASSLHALSSVLHAQGDLAGARSALDRSLTIQTRVHGTDEHPSVAASLHELGRVLHALGDLTGARTALERSLAIKTRVHGTDEHHDVAASLHELGGMLLAQGDLTGARTALERSLAVTIRIHGKDEHLDVGASLHELGRVLHAQGDLTGARTALERSLAIHAIMLGTDEHPSVAASLHAIGRVLHAQGDLTGARTALERSLAIRENVLGTDAHPAVAASLHAIGRVLHAQGDLTTARATLERSLAMRAKVLGTDEHPDVAASLHELGRVHHTQGDLPEARAALERSFAIRAKVLGTDEHPDVAASLHAQAVLLETEGNLEQAAAHYHRVLAIEAKCFGTLDQYHSAETEAALAMLLLRLGRRDEARELLQHALYVLEEQVPNHPILQELRALTREQRG